MAISLYDITVPVFRRGLDRLEHVLGRGRVWAEAEGIDPQALLAERLAPDMLSLTGQVQRASDTAKLAVVRLGEVENVPFADDEASLAEVIARIERTRAFLAAVPRTALDGREDTVISPSIGRRQVTLPARDYALGFALPNFFFHVTTAYAILRARGVPLGKPDFIGPLGET
ncbi:DUF1993 family protein [Amaricoccus sp.]|uniref:DUF1993 domain-containing protein n=1 Tax=Amaricoccus sp. TaxID=1872485 RepID=UPI001B4A8A0A|nr:DUF1993 domain-containing protein [Amaricoccus sp.]MBP7003259.1 DUF1993 domain-containing protein [Amaricoccus sp.]